MVQGGGGSGAVQSSVPFAVAEGLCSSSEGLSREEAAGACVEGKGP